MGETIYDLVERGGLQYKKFSDVPFTGKTTGKIQITYRKGKEHGPWVEYWDNGQLWFKETFKNGKQDGPFVSYHDNGKLWTKGDYKNSKRSGPWVSYYKDGKLDTKGDYKNGKEHGPWVSYNKDGTVLEERTGTFKNG
ncbi:hypothetical protein OAA86_11060, partial [Rhodospirillales bacterium]|nr:hypothetical protein [Rhodospirillales bacterium]